MVGRELRPWIQGCFFFSSRRRHTRLQGDWSSDVCSSDLGGDRRRQGGHHRDRFQGRNRDRSLRRAGGAVRRLRRADRKSTRLNSSHLVISYAVFCLKKKKSATDMHYPISSVIISHSLARL